MNKPETRQDVADAVREVVFEQLGLVGHVDKVKLKLDTWFVEDLEADSLDATELVMEFEDRFEIAIPDSEAEKLTTFRVAVNHISDKLGLPQADFIVGYVAPVDSDGDVETGVSETPDPTGFFPAPQPPPEDTKDDQSST